MKVLICGSRNWTDREMIKRQLENLPKGSIVIHGACRGADRIAGEVAKSLGLTVHEYPAEWDRYGKRAGILRNMEMFDNEDPDIVYAYHEDLKSSKGTKHMVSYATKHGCPVFVISGNR